MKVRSAHPANPAYRLDGHERHSMVQEIVRRLQRLLSGTLNDFRNPSGSRGRPRTIKTTCPLPFGTPYHGLARGFRGVTVSLHQEKIQASLKYSRREPAAALE